MTHRPQCPQRPTSRRTSLPRRTGPVSRSSRPQPPPRKATHDGSKTRLARGPQSSLQQSSTRGFGGHGSICAGHRLFIVGVLLRRPLSACLCPPPELMNVVSGRHLCPTEINKFGACENARARSPHLRAHRNGTRYPWRRPCFVRYGEDRRQPR